MPRFLCRLALAIYLVGALFWAAGMGWIAVAPAGASGQPMFLVGEIALAVAVAIGLPAGTALDWPEIRAGIADHRARLRDARLRRIYGARLAAIRLRARR